MFLAGDIKHLLFSQHADMHGSFSWQRISRKPALPNADPQQQRVTHLSVNRGEWKSYFRDLAKPCDKAADIISRLGDRMSRRFRQIAIKDHEAYADLFV